MSSEEDENNIKTKLKQIHKTKIKQIQKIDVSKELDKIFKDIKFIYANLFQLTLLKDKIIVNEECINKFDEFFESEKEYINNIQILFLTKVMLYFISVLKNVNKINDDEINDKEIKYNKILYELIKNSESDKIFSKFNFSSEDLKKYNLDKIILVIVEYLMNEMFKPKNYRQIKKEWDNLKINLELLEIKGEIKKDLYLFIENNEKMKNYYKNINFKKKQKILLEIYEYINYEISKIERKEDNNKIRLKTLGDKERKEKDYGRIIYQDLEKKEGKIEDKNNEKAPKSFLKQIYEKFKIKIDLSDCSTFDYFRGNNNETIQTFYDNNVKYDENTEDDRNYKKYLEFKDQVFKYIEDIRDEIKYKKENEKIVLELTTVENHQEGELFENYHGSDITKDLHYVRCMSYLVKVVNNKDEKKPGFDVIDENVLVHGINGKTPGFIFLVNELCNDEYEEKKND